MEETKQFNPNITYFFIPFRLKKTATIHETVCAFRSSAVWEETDLSLRYMYRYITNKLSGSNDESRCYFHFSCKEEFVKKELSFTPYFGQADKLEFSTVSMETFLFGTSVGICAIGVEYPFNDALRIARANFFLKLESCLLDHGDKKIKFVDLLLESLPNLSSLIEPFFYFNEKKRMNTMTLVQHREETYSDYQKELFYLRNSYRESYPYQKMEDDPQIFSLNPDVRWGISLEGIACVVNPLGGDERFYQEWFPNNFRTEYLFMYVWLLHQKYALYSFLLNVETEMDLTTLEEYKKKLYEFQTTYVYSCITEVPQYQYLYDKIYEVLGLQAMYQDVEEPLIRLSEMKKKNQEKATEKRLNILSALCIFSALLDGSDLFYNLISDWLNISFFSYIRLPFVVAVLTGALYLMFKKDKKK